jgi:hypothetical protein
MTFGNSRKVQVCHCLPASSAFRGYFADTASAKQWHTLASFLLGSRKSI